MREIAERAPEEEHGLLRRLHAESRARHLARPLALVGFMGAGKSSLGREIAAALGRPFVDTDEEVERRGGRTIPEWFARGEAAGFRALEAEVVRELAQGPPAVLSLGGGALLDAGSRALLLERCFVVHLFVSWPEVRAALPALRGTRPNLQGRTEAEVHDLYLARQWTYRGAHLRIDAPRTSVAEAAERVLAVGLRSEGAPERTTGGAPP